MEIWESISSPPKLSAGLVPPEVFSRLHFAFKQTRDALAASGGSTTAAADGVKLIKKMIVLTFARATIKSRALCSVFHAWQVDRTTFGRPDQPSTRGRLIGPVWR